MHHTCVTLAVCMLLTKHSATKTLVQSNFKDQNTPTRLIKIDYQEEGCGQRIKQQVRAFLLTESILEKLALEEL